MNSVATPPPREQALAAAFFDRVATDLSLICDRELALEGVQTQRRTAKVAAPGQIHISFKLEFRAGAASHHGALIVPLPDAIALAGYLMMQSDETVKSNRRLTALDRALKDSMLEIGNLIGAALDAAARDQLGAELSARARGCQGIRPGQNPAFAYAPGAPLACSTARARLHDLPTFEMVLQLPPVPPAKAA